MWVILIAYIYNPNDWLYLPNFKDLKNFTQGYSIVYIVGEDQIIPFDENRLKFERPYTPIDGLPSSILIGAYDIERGSFWIVNQEKEIYEFYPSLRSSFKRADIGFYPTTIKIARNKVGFFKEGKGVWLDKGNFNFTSPPNSFIFTYGKVSRDSIQKIPLLSPFFVLDSQLQRHYYNSLYITKEYFYLGVENYGLIIKDKSFGRDVICMEERDIGEVKDITRFKEDMIFLGEKGVKVWNGKEIKSFTWYDMVGGKEEDWVYELINLGKRWKIERVKTIDDTLFLLTPSKLFKIPSYEEVFSFKGYINDFVKIGDSIILATPKGAYLFIQSKNIFTQLCDPEGMLKKEVYRIFAKDSNIHFVLRGKVVTKYGDKWMYASLPRLLFHPLVPMASYGDVIAIAQQGIEIVNLRETKSYCLKKEDGLSSYNVNALYIDDGGLWIASEKGIARFNLYALGITK